MKFNTIAFLVLVVSSAYAVQPDDIAEKEKKVAEEIRNSAANLRKAENELKEKQNQLRGNQGQKNSPPGQEKKEEDAPVVDDGTVKILNRVPLKQACMPNGCPRNYEAWKAAMKKYDDEQALDYVADPVKIVNGIPKRPDCKMDAGDEHAKRKCATMHRAFDKAEDEYEKKAFARRAGGSKGVPQGKGPEPKTAGGGPPRGPGQK